MSTENLKAKALNLDSEDRLKYLRDQFVIPQHKIYLCSNSLGLPTRASINDMQQQINTWSEHGAHGWFHGKNNWYTALDEKIRQSLSIILGACLDEVAMMNSLTINLHLLLTSFYQPTKTRYKILIDTPTFSSDLYAIKSHLTHHGLNPDDALLMVKPRDNELLLRQEDIEKTIRNHGETIALVFFSSVNYLTGQAFDMSAITQLAQSQGCIVGFDLAHAAGNVPLQLHNHQIDFAVGCSYKYLCSGPGAPGFIFVHSKHHDKQFARLSGWWGNDPLTRFNMHELPEFTPHGGARSWSVSTPSVLAMTPCVSALQILADTGIDNLRNKSEKQTTFLLEVLEHLLVDYSVITPTNLQERGCQISLKINSNAEEIQKKLLKSNIVCDFRPPHVIRIAPSPLYNTFEEIYVFATILSRVLYS